MKGAGWRMQAGWLVGHTWRSEKDRLGSSKKTRWHLRQGNKDYSEIK